MRIKLSDLLKAALLVAISIILARFASIMIPIAGFNALRISFALVPIMLSGIMFGPFVGALTGALADVIGSLLFPMGAFHPGLTLTSALNGAIAGLMFKNLKIHKIKFNFNYANAAIIVILGAVYLMRKPVPKNLDLLTILQISIILLVTVVYAFLPTIAAKLFRQKSGERKRGVSFDKVAFLISVNYVINSVFLNTFFLAQLFGKGFMVMLPGRLLAGLVMVPMYSLMIYLLTNYLTDLGKERGGEVLTN